MARTPQAASAAPRRRGLPSPRLAVILETLMLACALIAVGRTRTSYIIAGVLALATIVLAVPIRGRSVAQSLALRTAFRRRARNKVAAPVQPVDLVPLGQWLPRLSVTQTRSAQGNEVGVVTDGESWTAILALVSDDELLADDGDKIDLSALSGLTVQDDIVFAGLQVVTYTVPAPVSALLLEETPVEKSYRELARALPPAVRRTWICVRLDPRLCLEAVARRGASTDAIHATLRFGLHRVQAALKRQGIRTRSLGPVEIYEVLSLTVGSGLDQSGERSVETWGSWQCDALTHTGRRIRSFGDTASLGYQALQEVLVAAPAMFAITSVTIDQRSRVSGAVRLVTHSEQAAEQAAEWLRAHAPHSAQLAPSGGFQLPIVLSTIPLGRQVA